MLKKQVLIIFLPFWFCWNVKTERIDMIYKKIIMTYILSVFIIISSMSGCDTNILDDGSRNMSKNS